MTIIPADETAAAAAAAIAAAAAGPLPKLLRYEANCV